MTTLEKIEKVLQEKFSPVHLQIEDNSQKHAGHAGAASGGGHYRVTIVSTLFEDKTPIEQHRLVNTALSHLFGRDIHALALKTLTPEEWEKKDQEVA